MRPFKLVAVSIAALTTAISPALNGAAYAAAPGGRPASFTEASTWKPGDQLTHQIGTRIFAHTREEGMAHRRGQFEQFTGWSPKVVEAAMVATATEGQHIVLKNGDCINDFSYQGGKVEHNVCLELKPGEVYPAELWTFMVDDVTYYVILPEKCRNWGTLRVAPPPCYQVNFDYRGQKDVKWYEGRARVSAHVTLTPAQLTRLSEDKCFFVHDSRGERKPVLGDCSEALFCPPGSLWPDVALATAVGLPQKAQVPAGFWWGLKDGEGYLSLPLWALPLLVDDVFCVDILPTPVTVPGYKGWEAESRFNRVIGQGFERTKKLGHYDHVMRGEHHY